MWKAESDPTHQAGEFLNWKILALFGIAALVGIGVVVSLVALGGNYGRMNVDEARHLYRSALPELRAGSIPVIGGLERVRRIPPDELQLSLQPTEAVLRQGKRAYETFCVHCHGPGGSGKGTVGQSFAPLPADLKSADVQSQTDGAIFHRISLGYKRHPPLGYTVSEKDRAALVHYIRSLIAPLGENAMVDLLAAFGIGFVGSLHCLGMCGPLVLAYSLNLEGPGSAKRSVHLLRNSLHHLAFHCGRLVTYGCLGGAAGLLFQTVSLQGTFVSLRGGVTLIGGGLMILLGSLLLKILPLPQAVNRFFSESGTRWGSRIAPLLRSEGPESKMMLGLFVGFLPCGLSWAMIVKAATTQDAFAGFSTMAAFGLGTAPALFLCGFFASFLSFKLRVLGEKVAACSIIIMGFILVSKGARIFV